MISPRMARGKRKQGLLHLSSKADYGFLLMMRLACDPEKTCSLRSISRQNGLSFFFLQKVALDLRRSGLIVAGRGKSGGYKLARPASKINLRQMVESVDGPLAIMGCLGDKNACARGGSCELRPAFDLINRTIVRALSEKNLNDLNKRHGHA